MVLILNYMNLAFKSNYLELKTWIYFIAKLIVIIKKMKKMIMNTKI